MNKFEKFLLFFNVENDPNVLEELYTQSEMTRSYTALLLLANFIALFGLITNSVAVIIGAMLISPLMGPIISFGFAYITSEKKLMKQSITTVWKSLLYVIISAAILSYISPLNNVTDQILARTKPNLYDLFIAVFSGLVVAVSFLSKKINSISTLTGVAIATSIIPPLSVVGFGIGTGNWEISVGSFLLFFTNFTAIVATTALSGILFGYRYFQNLKDFNYIKRRLITILLIIAAVSLPLSYTLKQSIENIKIRRVVNQSVSDLKNTTIFSLSYSMDKAHKLNISLALASDKPISKEQIDILRNTIDTRLNLKSNLSVTQVALKEDIINNKPTIIKSEPAVVPVETYAMSATKFKDKTDNMIQDVSKLLSPYTVTGYTIQMSKGKTTDIIMNVRKDTPCTDSETNLIANYVRTKYDVPVNVRVTTTPMFMPITYQSGQIEPEGGFQDYTDLKNLMDAKKKIGIQLISYPESTLRYKERMAASAERCAALTKYFHDKYGLPESAVTVSTANKAVKEPKIEMTMKVF